MFPFSTPHPLHTLNLNKIKPVIYLYDCLTHLSYFVFNLCYFETKFQLYWLCG